MGNPAIQIDRALIESGFEGQTPLTDGALEKAVCGTLEALDQGHLRVAEKMGGTWVTHDWVKKAILLYFRQAQMQIIEVGPFKYHDKIPLKSWTGKEGVRVVPPATARFGAFVSKAAILMPSYVNIGAFIGEGSMVDTWATVGSCAQIGAGVHLSGGVGIGGVLEPPQAAPVIIEDHAFIGSRAIIVEGVRVEEGAVVAAGVILTASTKIVDVSGSSERITQGLIPKNAVVIPGSLPKKFTAGTYGVPCALIIGHRKDSTDKKTSLNQTLRDFAISV